MSETHKNTSDINQICLKMPNKINNHWFKVRFIKQIFIHIKILSNEQCEDQQNLLKTVLKKIPVTIITYIMHIINLNNERLKLQQQDLYRPVIQ